MIANAIISNLGNKKTKVNYTSIINNDEGQFRR